VPAQLDDEQRDALCQRMLREARLTARLSHPGVITVYDVVSHDGRPFIVMELVHGPSLSDEIARGGPLPPERVAAIGLALLDALVAAHRPGSCTETSSRATCCWPPTAWCSATSGSRSASPTPG